MISVNFISEVETLHKTKNNQVLSSVVNSRYGKITRITYLDIQLADINQLNRKSRIHLELFTVATLSEAAIFEQEIFYNKRPSKYATLELYESRSFDFETLVPTTHPSLINFRYRDELGYQYFTVINKSDNKICEAGFIDRGFLGQPSGVVIDQPDKNLDQSQLFMMANLRRENG